MTQQTLATALGIAADHLARLEGGNARVNPAQLHALSKILDVPVSYFFDAMPRELDADFQGTPFADLGYLAGTGDDMRETLELVRAYLSITDGGGRRQVRDLARALAEKTPD